MQKQNKLCYTRMFKYNGQKVIWQRVKSTLSHFVQNIEILQVGLHSVTQTKRTEKKKENI